MGIKVKRLQVYPIQEENCQANQIIAEIKAERDDGITPHLSYEKYGTEDENVVYNYININSQTGKIYLTLQGVNAINTDHDNPDLDIQSLKFKVKILDTEEGDNIAQDVEVAVVRKHDEPPKILDDFVYDLYQGDAVADKIILDVRTLYPSQFYVSGDSGEYFYFKMTDYGRLRLTNSGVTYIQSLDPNTITSIDIKIEIRDQQDHQLIYKTYTIPFKKGKALQTVPKKSILEEIAIYLGYDLANKIRPLELRVTDLEKKVKILFDFLLEKDTPSFMDNIKGPEFFRLFTGDSDKIHANVDYDNFDYFQFFDEFLQDKKTVSYRLDDQSIKAQKKPINYNQQSSLEMDSTLFNSNINLLDKNIGYHDHPNNLYNLFQALMNQMDLKNQKILDNIIKKAIITLRKEYWSEFERMEKDYLTFKIIDSKQIWQQMEDQIWLLQQLVETGDWNTNDSNTTTNTVVTDYQSSSSEGQGGLIGQVKRNLSNINAINSLLTSDSFSDVYNYKGMNNDKTKGLIGKVHSIDDRHLEDWGRNNGWKMTNNGEIAFHNYNVLSTNSTTSIISFGNNSTSNVYFEPGGTSSYFNSSGDLYVNNSNGDVHASYYYGTAQKAEYADLAEYYHANKPYEFGTLLMIGGENEVTEFQKNQGPYVGIVSENPGMVLNSSKEDEDNWVLIALKGRVRVKLEKLYPGQTIKKGQTLYTSEFKPGCASPKQSINLIGYALEDYDSLKNKGKILIMIK